MKKQQGFSVIHIIMFIVLAGIIGFTGWYVWDTNKKASDTLESADQQSFKKAEKSSNDKNAAKKTAEDPTKDWKSYTSTAGKYSLKYPPAWVVAENPEQCTDGTFLVGPTKDTSGRCASDNGGMVSFSALNGDSSSEAALKAANYPDVTSESVTFADVTGKKYSGTFKTNPAEEVLIGPADGTKAVQYVFFTNNKTYILRYSQEPTQPNELANFELIVNKTFKFLP